MKLIKEYENSDDFGRAEAELYGEIRDGDLALLRDKAAEWSMQRVLSKLEHENVLARFRILVPGERSEVQRYPSITITQTPDLIQEAYGTGSRQVAVISYGLGRPIPLRAVLTRMTVFSSSNNSRTLQ